MTSDKASEARMNLDYALGEKRVKLGELSPSEFDEQLKKTLQQVDLRELRGFKPLRERLTRSPNNCSSYERRNPTEWVRVTPATRLGRTNEHEAFEFSTHVVSVCRGVHFQEVLYRRFESGEETTDRHIANVWGSHGGYIHAVRESILVVRRPNNHTYADENLFEVWYEFKKVPHEAEMVVTDVRTTQVSVNGFRKKFQEKYPRVARDLIWELASLTSQTLDTLRSQAASFERTVAKFERLSESITE